MYDPDATALGPVLRRPFLLPRHFPSYSINSPSSVPGLDFSDQLNYWNGGYPAVMITDTAFLRNQNYHTVYDTPERLDYNRMAMVVEGVYAAVLALAQ